VCWSIEYRVSSLKARVSSLKTGVSRVETRVFRLETQYSMFGHPRFYHCSEHCNCVGLLLCLDSVLCRLGLYFEWARVLLRHIGLTVYACCFDGIALRNSSSRYGIQSGLSETEFCQYQYIIAMVFMEATTLLCRCDTSSVFFICYIDFGSQC